MMKMNAAGVPIDFNQEYNYPRVIAFSGKFGSGKDSSANVVAHHVAILIDPHVDQKVDGIIHFTPDGILQLKFADALKEATAIMTGTSLEDQYSDDGKCKVIPGMDMTIATFQQVLGTVARLHIYPDIWIVPVINQCLKDKDDFCIISDCRFPNEIKAIHAIGGVVIRLNRPWELISEKSKAGRDPQHISETALDDCLDFDLIIENDGTQNEHLKHVLDFLSSLSKPVIE